MRRAALVLLLCALGACAGPQRAGDPGLERPLLILVSFDGWRWDYHTKAPVPNLQRLIAQGVRAEGLIPSFPPKTFPNHYTIVTGLYPGHHGIVSNTIFDPGTGRTFARSKPDEVRDPMWWGGEPIWVTAQRAGHAAGTLFWPGSEAPIGGMLPRFGKAYDESYPANDRVDEVLGWLDRPAGDRPSFVSLYFEDVDTAGHDDGPESEAVREAIVRADGYLGRLLLGLERRRLLDLANIVVVSDHGMSAVSSDRVVVLDDYISLDDVEIVDINPTLGLVPKPGREDAVHGALQNAHARLRVFRRAETPEHWRYRDHPRIPPLVGVVDEGWQVLRRNTVLDIVARRIRGAGGQHGYDPSVMSMRGLFVAAGPAFKRGVTVPAFENVHVYNALAMAMDLTPAPNDGDPAIARALLK